VTRHVETHVDTALPAALDYPGSISSSLRHVRRWPSTAYRCRPTRLASRGCADRVSNIQTGNYSGELGSSRGTHRHREDGLVVRTEAPVRLLWSPSAGRVDVRVSASRDQDCMLAAWLVGTEHEDEGAIRRGVHLRDRCRCPPREDHCQIGPEGAWRPTAHQRHDRGGVAVRCHQATYLDGDLGRRGNPHRL